METDGPCSRQESRILEDLEVLENFVGEAEAAQIFDTIQSSKSKWENLIDRETQ